MTFTSPTTQHICQGSAHGTDYIGWGGSARYAALATPLACRLSDRALKHPPISQEITRRRWIDESSRGIDESGRMFC
jgi:hypothetical protein